VLFRSAPQLSPLLAFRDHLHPAVHRVQEAVAERPVEDWSAEALAAVAHVTPRHLARLFRQHTGLSPRDYVEHVRAALARQALSRGASAPQAAALAGFSNDRQWRRARSRTQAAP
jgi:transcriptional regulator GlxA family with amidase domain